MYEMLFSHYILLSSREYGVDGAADLSMAMIFCFDDFQTLGLDPMYVWRAALATLEGVESGGPIRREEVQPPNQDTAMNGTIQQGFTV